MPSCSYDVEAQLRNVFGYVLRGVGVGEATSNGEGRIEEGGRKGEGLMFSACGEAILGDTWV